jgi:cobalt-zinc-cadmium efflux system outer membrane protein
MLSASEGGAQPVPPAPSPAAPPLALHDAIDEALRRHPDLAAIRARAAASASRAAVETPLPPPMLEGEVRQWPIDTVNPGNAQLMASLVQEFPSRDKRRLRAAQMSRESDVVAGEADLRAVAIAGEVRRAYADLWQARRTLDLQDAAAALLGQVAEAATARYAAGRGAQQDVLRALTERVRVEEQRVMAAELGRLAEARLNSLMQRGLDEAIGALDEPPADLDVEPAAVLEARALDGHADLRQVDRDTAAADAGIEAALAERGRDYLVAGGFMVMPDETNAWTARVGVSWPSAPWARGRLDAMTREAEARRAATLAERRSAERRVRLAVHEARTRAESAQRRLVVLRDGVVPQAEQAFEIARVAYQADRAGFLDLLEAQREWVAARLDLAAATADRQRAAADLVEALGVPEHDPATGAIR